MPTYVRLRKKEITILIKVIQQKYVEMKYMYVCIISSAQW